MDEKQFLDSLDPNRAASAETVPAAQFHIMDRARAEEMRKHLHFMVDSLVDKIEFDDKGFAVNGVSISQGREHLRVGMGGGDFAYVTHSTKLTVEVDDSASSIEKQIAAERERAARGKRPTDPAKNG